MILGSRPIFGFFPIDVLLHSVKTFFYFMPMFMLGMLCFYYKENIDNWIRKAQIQIISIFCLSIVCLFSYIYMNNYDWTKWWQYGITSPFSWFMSIIFLKTVCVIFLLKAVLEKLIKKGTNLKVLDILSRYSFGLFFLHYFINDHIGGYLKSLLLNNVTSNRPMVMIIVIVSVMILTLLICIVLKKIFGKYSRMVCGC